MDRELFKKTVEDFLTYLHVERNCSAHTLNAYRLDLGLFVAFWDRLATESKQFLSIRQVIERYLVSLYYQKKANSSIARKFSAFTSFARFAASRGITVNITLSRPKVEKKLPVFLSVDEMFHLLDNIKDEENLIPSTLCETRLCWSSCMQRAFAVRSLLISDCRMSILSRKRFVLRVRDQLSGLFFLAIRREIKLRCIS